jgi:hypothetical protein
LHLKFYQIPEPSQSLVFEKAKKLRPGRCVFFLKIKHPNWAGCLKEVSNAWNWLLLKTQKTFEN